MGDFLYWVAVAVVAGLILAGLGYAFRYLRVEKNREALRRRLCRHDWETMDQRIGSPNVIFVSPYLERCRKCGARQ